MSAMATSEPEDEFSALQERIDDCAEHLTATRERLATIRAKLRELRHEEDDAAAVKASEAAMGSANGLDADGEGSPLGGDLHDPARLSVHSSADDYEPSAEQLAAAASRHSSVGRNHRDLDPETRVVMDRSIRAFNINPKRGVRVIVESGFVEEGDDEGLARFLAATVGLNKVKLGEWLGEPDDRNVEVLFNYARTYAFEGVGFERAFRMYLSRFELPGESQKIDRIMEAFAAAFYDKNPSTFSSADVVHVLAFSAIMLNTDAHNDAVLKSKKMTEEEFINNNRGIDNGESLPAQLLSELYQGIVNNEILTTKERDDEGNLFTDPLKEGWMRKQGGIHKGWSKRWFILSASTLFYFQNENDIDPRGFFPLENVEACRSERDEKQIELRPKLGGFLKSAKYENSGLVTGNHKKCILKCPNADEAARWVDLLNESAQQGPQRR